MKTGRILSAVSLLLLGSAGFAKDAGAVVKSMERGVYYTLSERLAITLGINYSELVRSTNLAAGEQLVVKVNEEDGEIDVTIFDQRQFHTARVDIMQ